MYIRITQFGSLFVKKKRILGNILIIYEFCCLLFQNRTTIGMPHLIAKYAHIYSFKKTMSFDMSAAPFYSMKHGKSAIILIIFK